MQIVFSCDDSYMFISVALSKHFLNENIKKGAYAVIGCSPDEKIFVARIDE